MGLRLDRDGVDGGRARSDDVGGRALNRHRASDGVLGPRQLNGWIFHGRPRRIQVAGHRADPAQVVRPRHRDRIRRRVDVRRKHRVGVDRHVKRSSEPGMDADPCRHRIVRQVPEHLVDLDNVLGDGDPQRGLVWPWPAVPATNHTKPIALMVPGSGIDLAVDRGPVREVRSEIDASRWNTGRCDAGRPDCNSIAPRCHDIGAPEERIVEVPDGVVRRPEEVHAESRDAVDPGTDARQDRHLDIAVGESNLLHRAGVPSRPSSSPDPGGGGTAPGRLGCSRTAARRDGDRSRSRRS